MSGPVGFHATKKARPGVAEVELASGSDSPMRGARGVAGLNFTWPVAELHVASVPEMPSTSITRLSCGVDLQGNQVCMCDAGWYGPQCDQLCNCTGAGIARCNEGPEGDGSCICKDGYLGERCDQCKQYYYNLENGCAIYCHPDDYCNGHGECTTHPVTHQINGCQCYQEWAGRSPGPTRRYGSVYCTKNTTCSGKGALPGGRRPARTYGRHLLWRIDQK
ncbi:unnamed protein product [Effrenium voratum]|uniref:Laminin EGF-like domain-containing protein n=1 Tax=Effrenium voratum TaxID=2562239 RepID=A0AA36MY27_9DINO|nr:unnamed protein product [Effrenium voratum]